MFLRKFPVFRLTKPVLSKTLGDLPTWPPPTAVLTNPLLILFHSSTYVSTMTYPDSLCQAGNVHITTISQPNPRQKILDRRNKHKIPASIEYVQHYAVRNDLSPLTSAV